MRSQVVYLDVVVPPDILLNETSSDIIAPEGSDVTLQCHATGNPEPVVRWRREDNVDIPLTSGRNLKRIQAIWIPNPSLESQVNSDVILNCHIEAYPPSTNYWMTGNDKPIEASEKYAIKVDRRSYKTHLQLVIKNVNKTDFGMYKCLAKNALGTQERQVRLSEASSIFALAKHQRRGHQSTEFNDFRSSNSVNQRAMYSSKGSKLEDKATNGRQVYRVSLSVSLLALLIIAMA
ncbi:Neuronal growth regulator 1 [Halotydeus destructor]|nr:Neuronal growth regulator 1 [Halotydeus destructor]